jgi:hypothetical protein
MKATLRIGGGGAAEEVMTVAGDRCRPFIELTIRDREVLLTRTEARMASDALRALALLEHDDDFDPPPTCR